MRLIAMLGLCVSLAGSCLADDWRNERQKVVEAFKRKSWTEAVEAVEGCVRLAETPLQRAVTADDYGNVLQRLGRNKQARAQFERAVDIWRTVPDSTSELAQSVLGIADVQSREGDPAGARTTILQYLSLEGLSVESQSILHNAIGDKLRQEGLYLEARAHFLSTIALSRILPSHRLEAVMGIADLDRQTGRWKESIAGWKDALELARSMGRIEFEVYALEGLGITECEQGNLAQAEPLLRRSLALAEANPGMTGAQRANVLTSLATLYRREKKLGLAEEYWLRALQAEETSGREAVHIAADMEALSEAYSLENRVQEARQYAANAYSIASSSFGAQSLPAANALFAVAIVQERGRDLALAADNYAEVIDIYRTQNAAAHQTAINAMTRYANVLSALHRGREAKQMQKEIRAFQAQ
jgi:tetratricopeptide (TPR) repeat protein